MTIILISKMENKKKTINKTVYKLIYSGLKVKNGINEKKVLTLLRKDPELFVLEQKILEIEEMMLTMLTSNVIFENRRNFLYYILFSKFTYEINIITFI